MRFGQRRFGAAKGGSALSARRATAIERRADVSLKEGGQQVRVAFANLDRSGISQLFDRLAALSF